MARESRCFIKTKAFAAFLLSWRSRLLAGMAEKRPALRPPWWLRQQRLLRRHPPSNSKGP
jgi:hypothetical protein